MKMNRGQAGVFIMGLLALTVALPFTPAIMVVGFFMGILLVAGMMP